MAKYIVYFSKEVYGYKEIEAENDEEAEDKIAEFESNGDFDKELDHIKDDGWTFVDYDKAEELLK